MVSDAERVARAGDYVLGRMSAGERERAERDLETDAEFRLAVMAAAERMRGAEARGDAAEAGWAGIAQHLAALPHMQGMAVPEPTLLPGESLAASEAPRSGAFRHALRGWAGGLLRLLPFRRRRAPARIAVLLTPERDAAAVVEVDASGAARLLLAWDFPLRPGERLSLWARRADGSSRRLGGFAPEASVRLEARLDEPAAGFALASERIARAPSGRMGTPLAEGLLRPLFGHDGDPLAAGDPLLALRPPERRGRPGW